jgi:hypothetical protein
MAKYTKTDVIQKLGIEEENLNNAETMHLIEDVLAIANEMQDVDFAFIEDITENRVLLTGEIVATIDNVVIFK